MSFGASGQIAAEAKIHLFSKVQVGSVAHPASYSMGNEALPLGLRHLGHDDHLPPPSAKVNNEWSYTFTPPIHHHCM
jgi:hypothetical protein